MVYKTPLQKIPDTTNQKQYLINWLVFILLFLAAVWNPSSAQFENYQSYQITPEDGLPDISITAIFQDTRGFVWLGSRTGLYRYNGYSYQKYDYQFDDSTSISSNQIYRIIEDKSGNLWVTTPTELNKFDREKETFTHYQHLPYLEEKDRSDLIGIAWGKPGKLLLSTWEGSFLEMDIKTETYRKIELSRESDRSAMISRVSDIRTDKNGTLWVATHGEGLYAFDINNGYKLIQHYQHKNDDATSLKNDTLFGLYISNNGKIWIGSEIGLEEIIPGNTGTGHGYVKQIDFHFQEQPNIKENAVIGIIEDKKGNLWLRSEHGIIAYRPETGKSKIWPLEYSEVTSFNSFFSFKALLIDNTGELWSSNYQDGITRIKYQKNPFDFIQHDETNSNSLNNNKVTAIYQDTSGVLWLGTREHGLNKRIPAHEKNDTESWVHYIHDSHDPNSISSNEIRSIMRDSRGDLWIGTPSGGINKMVDKGKGQAYFKSYRPVFVEEDKKDALNQICEDHEGNLWIGGSGLFLFDRDKEQFFQYVADTIHTDSLPFVSYVNGIETNSGSIWVSTYNDGLYKLTPPFKIVGNFITGTTKSYNNDTKLQGNPSDWGIRSICVPKIHREHIIWVGTENSLLCLKKDKRENGTEEEYFVTFTKEQGLPDLTVQGIEEDNEGNIWVSTKDGLSRYDPETGIFINYYEEDGLPDDFFKMLAHHKSHDGKLYFGVDGVISFYPDDIIVDDYVPPVYISKISIFNTPLKVGGNSPLKKTVSETKEIILSHDQNFITLQFATLNYNKKNNTQFKYMLEGFETEWMSAGTQRYAGYQGLSPGKYTFRVIALNNGVWDQKGATLKITITPPWWRSVPAIVGYILLLVLIIYTYITFRERKLIHDKKVLEKKVKERTEELQEINIQLKEHHEELEQQKEELQQTLDHLKETQSQLVQSEKMASVGQLTAGIAHEINNPVNYISGGIESLEINLKEIREILDMYNEITPGNVIEKLNQINELKQRLDYKELLKEIEDLTGSIKTGSARTTEIVKGLRTFSRLDENEIKQADIHEGIDLTLVMLHNKYKQHVEIVKQYGEIPMVDCYPGKLNQVFMNILSNAIDAISEKGTIIIKTWDEKQNNKVYVSIKDDGMGIPQDIKTNIFNPFYTTKEVGKGTGLGLSVSHGIIEQHKGKIKVVSSPGKGAEFIISIPIKQD